MFSVHNAWWPLTLLAFSKTACQALQWILSHTLVSSFDWQLVLIQYRRGPMASFHFLMPNFLFLSRCGRFPVHLEPPLATWPVSLLHLCGYIGTGSSLRTKADNWCRERRCTLWLCQFHQHCAETFIWPKQKALQPRPKTSSGFAPPIAALFACCDNMTIHLVVCPKLFNPERLCFSFQSK